MSGSRVVKGHVIAVLLADRWHQIAEHSFTITTQDGDWRGTNPLGGRGSVPNTAVANLCFCFATPDGSRIEGPLSSVLAVRTAAP